jgi:outer membrane lipoprotein SlyB
MSSFEDAPREISRNMNQPLSGAKMQNKTHPAIIIAAGAVTILCAVGIGVLTGIIPSAGALNSNSAPTTQTSLPPVLAAAGAAQTPLGSVTDDTPSSASSTLKPIDKPAIGQPLARNESRQNTNTAPANKPTSNATNNGNAPVPTYQSNAQNPSSSNERPVVTASNTKPEPSPIICANCGVIESINTNVEQGQGSGAGAVIGGVLGGVLGNQVGKGRGRDVATVAGAVGGAVLGNTIEKSKKSTQSVSIRVRLEDGTFQTIKSDTDQGMRIGDRVKIENQRLLRN